MEGKAMKLGLSLVNRARALHFFARTLQYSTVQYSMLHVTCMICLYAYTLSCTLLMRSFPLDFESSFQKGSGPFKLIRSAKSNQIIGFKPSCVDLSQYLTLF